MIVEIKLPDPQDCTNCPCLHFDDSGEDCNLGYWPSELELVRVECDGITEWRNIMSTAQNNQDSRSYFYIKPRPRVCIDKHGL